MVTTSALFNRKTSILIQKRDPYTENVDSATPGDSKNTFLHCEDVFGGSRPPVQNMHRNGRSKHMTDLSIEGIQDGRSSVD